MKIIVIMLCFCITIIGYAQENNYKGKELNIPSEKVTIKSALITQKTNIYINGDLPISEKLVTGVAKFINQKVVVKK
ncbi:hypothetical protein [Aureibaculum conchae]|uniref:hypothetical protein n=1 Tax=Aureibaculum sp. 2308TA14-22 TaxID=3108392 RepID=UPI003396C495